MSPNYISKGGNWKPVIPKTVVKEADELNITGDGVVDAKDASLAGKVLADKAKKTAVKKKVTKTTKNKDK